MSWIYEDELTCNITPIMFEFSRVVDGVRIYPACDNCGQVLRHDGSGTGICVYCNTVVPLFRPDESPPRAVAAVGRFIGNAKEIMLTRMDSALRKIAMLGPQETNQAPAIAADCLGIGKCGQ